MELSEKANGVIGTAVMLAHRESHEYVTPEHLMLALCMEPDFKKAAGECGFEIKNLEGKLKEFMKDMVPCVKEKEPELSQGAKAVIDQAAFQTVASGKSFVEPFHLLNAIMEQKECWAAFFLYKEYEDFAGLLSSYISVCEEEEDVIRFGGNAGLDGVNDIFGDEFMGFPEGDEDCSASGREAAMKYVTCLNDTVKDHNPLIGREEELERTIQILCCLDKNNPLHIGEAGTGKTSITYGLAERINEGKVPPSLEKAKIYMLDLAGLVAGTQYRGDYEKRMRNVMMTLAEEECPIVFIDEIHTIVGAGDSSGSMDAAGLLKPWFEDKHMRFIGSTTHEEYNRTISKNAGLVRRFQNVEIKEPSIEECVQILEGIRWKYEEHHSIIYGEGFMDKAVELSARYMNDRFLPDKAISLIDEAGAWLQLHPEASDGHTVTGMPIAGCDLLDLTISKVCRIPREQLNDNEEENLVTLKPRMEASVFGQEEAIEKTVYQVLSSRLGLVEEHKPVASLLYVGPTGVGKTETAKVLAKELGVAFLRFDMSEYTEKHTIAKLIGSPAGYVGFEDGGQLTDAIRKNPHCVLLLDEIEKAHSDIYNVLLQVMDYATLTDNHGKKADFSHVILIMTSNAGAASVGKQLIGFGERSVLENNMMEEVRKVFSPEFRNRLSDVIVFHHLSKEMAKSIVEKELKLLSAMLAKRAITLQYDESVYEYILEKGYSKEYGAREIKRVVADKLKPAFVKEMLTGILRREGSVKVSIVDGAVTFS